MSSAPAVGVRLAPAGAATARRRSIRQTRAPRPAHFPAGEAHRSPMFGCFRSSSERRMDSFFQAGAMDKLEAAMEAADPETAPVITTEVAVIALGHPEASFGQLRGVVSTCVGYTGGESQDPTYRSVCGGDGHTEALKIEYDPAVISYEKILDIFWKEHSPRYKAMPQYKSAIWPTTEEQLVIAMESKMKVEKKLGGPVSTDIEMAKPWYDAEEYHQKYIEKMAGRKYY